MRAAAQPVEPAECRAACCATFCKSPNLSGPRLCRSPVEAAESPAARRPGQPAHLQRRVRSDQLRSRQRQPHSPSVHQQRHRLGRGQAQAGGRRPAPPPQSCPAYRGRHAPAHRGDCRVEGPRRWKSLWVARHHGRCSPNCRDVVGGGEMLEARA